MSCFDNKCEWVSGCCIFDCFIGFYGDFCLKNCSMGCDGVCNWDIGICFIGCKWGFYGDICVN